jgi:hypothetical protein
MTADDRERALRHHEREREVAESSGVAALEAERDRLVGFGSGWAAAAMLCVVGVPSLLRVPDARQPILMGLVAAVTLVPAAVLLVHDGLRRRRIRRLEAAIDRALALPLPGDPARGAGASGALLLALCLLTPPGLSGQSFQGVVLDVENGAPVSLALVRLLGVDGKDVDFALADTLGRYRVTAPGPGTYRLVAERLGYAASETPLLEVANQEGVYSVELTARRVPLPIAGIEVTVERQRELERAIHLVVGANPRSLRTPPIPRRVIEDHLAKGHSLPDLVAWSNSPITVRGFGRDRCFEHRGVCMRVFLNGVPLDPGFFDVLPLDMVETVVVVGRNESIVYDNSLLLYTAGWLR